MKITAIETLRTEEFANVLWVRVHTDSGHHRPRRDVLRRRRGRGAYPRHAGRAPARPRSAAHRGASTATWSNLPMAQSSTGAEYRARLGGRHRAVGHLRQGLQPAGAPDARRPVPRQAAHLQHLRRLQVCPLAPTSSRSPTGTSARPAGPIEDLDGFMNRADALAESLLESGITAMKIWPFDPAAIENQGLFISAEQMKTAHRAVREDPQGRRRQDGDHGRVPLAVEPADRQARSPRRSSPTRRPGTRTRSG